MHFDEMAQLHIFERLDVACHELSYTRSEHDLMKLIRREDVLAARSAVDDDISTGESVCLMGIEHLLTPAIIKEVRACRTRCTRAVLAEQARARQGSYAGCSSDAIALASVIQTRKATLRARKLGEIHHKSS